MENNNARLALWFAGGAALGAVVTLLLAPKSGAGTRQDLIEGAERGRKSLLETSQEIFEKGRELFEKGREIAEEAAQIIEKGRMLAEKKVEDRF